MRSRCYFGHNLSSPSSVELISLLSLEFGSISSSPPVNVIVRMPRALRSGRSPAMTAPIALNVVDRGQHASGLIGATVSTYITVQVVRTDMTNYMEDYFTYGIFPGLRYLALLAAAVLIYPLPLIFGRERGPRRRAAFRMVWLLRGTFLPRVLERRLIAACSGRLVSCRSSHARSAPLATVGPEKGGHGHHLSSV